MVSCFSASLFPNYNVILEVHHICVLVYKECCVQYHLALVAEIQETVMSEDDLPGCSDLDFPPGMLCPVHTCTK